MRKSLLLLLSVLFLYSCGMEETEKLSTDHLNLTPKPQYIVLKTGELDITKGFNFTTNLTDSFSVDLKDQFNRLV